MKRPHVTLLCALALCAIAAFSLLGCGGCSGTRQQKEQPCPTPDQQKAAAAPQLLHGIPLLPVEQQLSPEALDTFAYLVFSQALHTEDDQGLAASIPLMVKARLPANIWLEGGVWLLGRKSSYADVLLQEALALWPEDLSLNLLYAEFLMEKGMPEGGIRLMRDFLKKHPSSLDARLELALLLVKTQQFSEAVQMLNGIKEKERTPLVDYYHARALIGMDKHDAALPHLQRAVKELPDFTEALTELAFLYERKGDLKAARSTYEHLLKLQVAPQDVLLRLIHISLQLRQPERALTYLRQGPEDTPFQLTVAGMLLESRHYLQAETILKRLAQRKAPPAEVYLMLSEIAYEQQRDLTMAFTWLDKIPAGSKAAVRGLLQRVQLLVRAGKDDRALDIARKAVATYPDAQDVAEVEIRLLARLQHKPLALEKARASVARWQDNADMLFLLGALQDETGDKKAAYDTMEHLLTLHPENYQALNYVGYTLAEEGRDLERAVTLLLKADTLAPNHAYIVDSLAWAYFKSGKLDEALREIRRAVSLDNDADPSIWEHYGDIAARMRLSEEARRAYLKALEHKPDNAEALRQRLSGL